MAPGSIFSSDWFFAGVLLYGVTILIGSSRIATFLIRHNPYERGTRVKTSEMWGHPALMWPGARLPDPRLRRWTLYGTLWLFGVACIAIGALGLAGVL